MRTLLIMGVAILGILGMAASTPVLAQEQPADRESAIGVIKEVTGELGVIRPLYLTVIYDRDELAKAEYEMLFQLDDSVTLSNRRSFEELKPGDEIEVTYRERVWVTPEGEEKSSRETVSVRYLGAGNTGLSSGM